MRVAPFLAAMAAVCLVAAAPPSKKPAAGPKPSQARGARQATPSKGDPYSVTVPVDASGPSASVAQTTAITGGRVRAWLVLSHRLLPQKELSRLPALDSRGLERLIRGYTVAGEKRSTTRYIARVTYIFNPGAVRHLLRSANIGLPEQTGTAILLVGMSPTYAAQSPWAQALKLPKYAAAQFPLVTPIGDAVDQSSLGSVRFADASWSEVEPIASRVHANEAVLVQASNPNASKMTIRMRRIGPGRPFALPDIEIPVPAGTPAQKAYAMAAEQAEAAVEDAWKLRTSIDFARKTKMTAEARIVSLEQWSDLLAKLQGVPVVSDVTIFAMNVGEARINISYSGTLEQLRNLAAQSGITFSNRDGLTWVSRGKPASPDGGEER